MRLPVNTEAKRAEMGKRANCPFLCPFGSFIGALTLDPKNVDFLSFKTLKQAKDS